jgi:hypothetical protein
MRPLFNAARGVLLQQLALSTYHAGAVVLTHLLFAAGRLWVPTTIGWVDGMQLWQRFHPSVAGRQPAPLPAMPRSPPSRPLIKVGFIGNIRTAWAQSIDKWYASFPAGTATNGRQLSWCLFCPKIFTKFYRD